MKNQIYVTLFAFIISLVCLNAVSAQTSAFVYQGKLQDGQLAASGSYQFEFKLYDAPSGGNKIGTTLTDVAATVSGGAFAVNLDFGPDAFNGGARYLDISVRMANSAQPYTPLNPREAVTSTPYAVKSLKADAADNSAKLGGIDANQYVTGPVVKGINNITNNVTLAAGPNITITPNGSTLTIASAGGVGNGIQNQTSLQASADFNIDGTGQANILSAAKQFNIGKERILSVGPGNLFVGNSAGSNTTSYFDTFIGPSAGSNNTTGGYNSFLGTAAGQLNTTGGSNSFFGFDAGSANKTGERNSYFGSEAGQAATGERNAFFGNSSGFFTSTGNRNSFFGQFSGLGNKTGSDNTIIGNNADVGAENLTFATAIGAGAVVPTSNTIMLGRNVDTVIARNLLQVNTLGSAGSTSLCRNAQNLISTCTAGNRAEDVSTVAIDGLREQVKQQREMIEALKESVCSVKPDAPVCKVKQ